MAPNRLNGVLPMIPYPCPDEVPEWSNDTETLLRELSALERSFVEWTACGMNGAEAYRKAKGLDVRDGAADYARNNAYSILARPRVQAALNSAMKDMNFEARMTRAWMLQRLELALIKVEASDKAYDQEVAAKIIEVIAKLKGEIGNRHESETSGNTQRVDVHVRIDAVLADVSALIAGRTGSPPPAITIGRITVNGAGSDDAVGAE